MMFLETGDGPSCFDSVLWGCMLAGCVEMCENLPRAYQKTLPTVHLRNQILGLVEWVSQNMSLGVTNHLGTPTKAEPETGNSSLVKVSANPGENPWLHDAEQYMEYTATT